MEPLLLAERKEKLATVYNAFKACREAREEIIVEAQNTSKGGGAGTCTAWKKMRNAMGNILFSAFFRLKPFPSSQRRRKQFHRDYSNLKNRIGSNQCPNPG